MPDIRDIPPGTNVFVDTNIFYYHFSGQSPTCTAFLRRIAQGEVNAYVNTEVLSDLLHKLMLYEACKTGIITRQRASDLKTQLLSNRRLIEQSLPDHQNLFESILGMGLKMLRVSKKLFIDTKQERKNHGLMTNDSIHLGTMIYRAAPITHIATRDADFRHITKVTIWEPMDIIN